MTSYSPPQLPHLILTCLSEYKETFQDSSSFSQIPIKIDENEVLELQQSILEAQYFDASSMAPLSAASIAALAKLRSYKPPPFDSRPPSCHHHALQHTPKLFRPCRIPRVREGGQATIAEEFNNQEEQGLTRYKVWGLTARILVDAARIAYGEEPEFEHNAHVGDEGLIARLQSTGHLGEKVLGRKDVTDANVNDARKEMKEEKSGAKKFRANKSVQTV
ncbi:hypothetical protein DID88_004945 [Monilinia fructigena]|uniref:Uncharacterized protein n=1 Tax=Monilinia fructigena TaxID=38457 RepID=A0A395IVK2_9HELO|nr:hypothetical protein DID88_004945 [Monilinia fructigena]